MNILQLVPKLNIGGVEKGTIEVARYLTLNGHKAVVASGGGKLEKKLAAIGARHYKVPVGRKNPFLMIYAYFMIRRIIARENIDIVHARSRVPALVSYFAARSMHRTFITTAHGQYKKHLISRVMGWGKIVIAANETMARHMKENFQVPVQKISVIPRGVDLKKFSYVDPGEKDPKVFRIGMISRFSPLKGHLDFLKAASYVSRRMSNVRIVLMGDRNSAKEEYMKKIEMTIRRLGLEPVVEFVPSDQEVDEVMQGMHVLVSANREQEAFGRSIIEAQARGVAVVATKVGGVAETVDDGVTGLFCRPGDPQDMAHKILRYAEDADFTRRVTKTARKHVEENFSLDKMMNLTFSTYRSALSRKNILIFKISSLGDIVLSTPSIRAMRKKFPTASIKVLVDVKFRQVLEKCPYIDEVITSDLKGRDRGIGFFRLSARLRAEDFDLSIDLQNNRKSHLLAFLTAIPERYGFDNGKLSFLLNRKISMPAKPVPPVKHQKCLLGLLGITGMDEELELWTDKKCDKWAEEYLASNWLKKDQRIVAFSLSASRKWSSKNWTLSQFVELAEKLESEKSIRVLLIGAAEDRARALKFVKKTAAKPINAVGMTDIPQLVALIKRCDALLTGDSAPMHIAAAVGTPFVAIFGPTDPKRHLSPADNFRFFHKRIKCAPCYRPVCNRDKKCMSLVSPEEVFEAVMEVMDLTPEKRPQSSEVS
ncbi:MAG: lipopolysaccharide heptosyltransferase II [Candidatus Omnitrophica bacterium]|nr:lipopolysaccharide heptosyltransferase II [Candidatus Omnitrophota bacterium]